MGKLLEYIKQPLWDNWYIYEKIGQGTYSEVYKIYSENKISALKVKPVFADNPESLNRKLAVAGTEADIMDTLKSCPYIVGYQDRTIQKITDFGYLFMIRMEYLRPLAEQANIFLSEEKVRKIALDIGKALEYIHRNGIVHCDVKPDNFFISPDGRYKLGDFNISGYYGESRYPAGTKGYLAPEISDSGALCSYQTDIYSFGVSLCRLAENIDVSPEFSEIIMKACSCDVRDRYRTVSEMLSDISGLRTDYYVSPAEYFG